MKISSNTMPLGTNIADVENDHGEQASEQRRHQMLGIVSGVAILLVVATVLFFAIYNRAELQFLFSKPGM